MMDLKTKIKNINSTSKLKKLPNGTAKDINELWENVIEPNLPSKTSVEKWHEALKDYISNYDLFVMRYYGSPSGKSHLLRRGFLNQTNNKLRAFYCDNFFTSYFYSMAYDGDYDPKASELYEAFEQRWFPCGCIQTTAEKKFAAYKKGKNPGISRKGYKIAHVYSSGEDFNLKAGYKSIGCFCDTEFPRGINTDWNKAKSDKIGKYHYRDVNIDPSKQAKVKDFLIAHFIRTVHPINYFLVPNKPNRYDTDTGIMKTNIYWKDCGIEKDEIGEDAELISFVSDKLRMRYGSKIYDEFLSWIFPKPFTPAKNKTIDAEYGIDIWKTKITPGSVVSPCKKTKCPVSKTRTKIKIIFDPSNEDMFKNQLLSKKKATIKWIYSDGKIIETTWNANRMCPASNIRGNIQSKQEWREKEKKGLVEVHVYIV